MKSAHSSNGRSESAGFSLIELVIVLGVLGVLGAGAVLAVGHVRQAAEDTKVQSDVVVLNSAVRAYLTNGGWLTGTEKPAEVIRKLQSQIDPAEAPALVGHRGPFLDARVEALPLQGGTQPRLVWDSRLERFHVATQGEGIHLRLGDGTAQAPTEKRSTILKFAKFAGWVWDFAEAQATSPERPTDAAAIPVVRTPLTPPVAAAKLQPPVFSIGGGYIPNDQLPRDLLLTNPNPPGSSTVLFRVNGSEWQEYTGKGIRLDQNLLLTTVTAYAASTDENRWIDSDSRENAYSTFFFRLKPDLVFKNPKGQLYMATNLVGGAEGRFMQWGVPAHGHKRPHELEVKPASELRGTPEVFFPLGEISYRNSTTWVGTNATSVELHVRLSFLEPAGVQEQLVFPVRLVSTPNLVKQTNEENADYIWLPLTWLPLKTQFPSANSSPYYLQIIFAQVSSGGAVTGDALHVQEGVQAKATVMARLTTNPQPITDVEKRFIQGKIDPSSNANGHEIGGKYKDGAFVIDD